MTVQIITIDGPSGSGKGTLAAKLAAYYQFHLLDSGALYRLLGLSLHKHDLLEKLDSHLDECVEDARQLNIKFETSAEGTLVFLDEEDVSQTIRTERVGEYASKVAAIPELRQALLNVKELLHRLQVWLQMAEIWQHQFSQKPMLKFI